MNFAAYLTASNSSGLFELKNDGTVLYSRFRQNDRLLSGGDELIGHNFFEDVAGFENARELHRIFNSFVKSNKFTDNFIFECRYADETVRVRVMMVRAFENKFFDSSGIVIMDIRNNFY
jgi:hypothetical protein